MDAVKVVACTILVALSAAGIVPLVRQIPYIRVKMFAGVKPWVCDLCMSFWSTLLSAVCWYLFYSVPLISFVPAFSLTFLVVRKNSDPVGLPPPMLQDMDD